MFYRQKNRRLADLRMIDDQIKSDCKFHLNDKSIDKHVICITTGEGAL